jgi:hypothetical protein
VRVTKEPPMIERVRAIFGTQADTTLVIKHIKLAGGFLPWPDELLVFC